MNVTYLCVAANWLHLQDFQADASCEPCSVASHTHTDLLFVFLLCEQKKKRDNFMVDNIFFCNLSLSLMCLLLHQYRTKP